MNVIIISLLCMFCYGAFDYLIAKPARNISLKYLILIFAAINTVLLGIYVWIVSIPLEINHAIIFPLLTGIAGNAGVFFYSKSLQKGKIGISSSITNSYPLIAVLLGYIFLGEYLNVFQWIFFLLIILGIIFSSFRISEIAKFKIKKDKRSLGYACLAMCSYALFVYFFDRSVEYFDPVYAAFISEFFIFFVLITLLCFYDRKIVSNLKQTPIHIYVRISYISILGMIGFVALGTAFNIGSLALVSAISACSPAVTTLFARIFGKEKLESIQYIAIGILVFAIAGLSYVSV